jgi:hypothetical protein
MKTPKRGSLRGAQPLFEKNIPSPLRERARVRVKHKINSLPKVYTDFTYSPN